jgi:hypothetical protein
MGMIYNARRAARLARRVKNKLEKHLSVTKDFYFNIDSPIASSLHNFSANIIRFLYTYFIIGKNHKIKQSLFLSL